MADVLKYIYKKMYRTSQIIMNHVKIKCLIYIFHMYKYTE